MLRRISCASITIFCVFSSLAGQQPAATSKFPFNEKLTYSVEWRLIHAGSASVQLLRDNSRGWNTTVKIESAGLVDRLYHVLDTYKIATNEHFCGVHTELDAQENKKHTVSTMAFDGARKKVLYEERDLNGSESKRKEIDTAACSYEIVGALTALRTASLPVGKSVTLPITDGKKFVEARIVAQSKESVTVNGKSYATIRYEAFLFDNVLYKRRGRFLIWLTDDSEHTPVEFRLLMGFPLGTITIRLDKQEKYG